MKPLIALALLGLNAPLLWAGSFPEDLQALQKTKSPKEIGQFITQSYEANKANPEYFVAAANYWWGLAQSVDISRKPSVPGDFSVRDPKTGKEAGSISTLGRANPELPKKAVNLLTEGYKRNPNRLDIALGLAYVLREQTQYEEAVKVLKQALKLAADHPDQIRWKQGGRPPGPLDQFVPKAYQGHTVAFYQLETKQGDALCQELCLAITKAYPGHPYAYNLLAALSAAHHDDKACLGYLHLALQKDPEDSLVLLNLGDAYRRIGDNTTATGYYQQVLASKTAPEESKTSAKNALSKLKGPR